MDRRNLLLLVVIGQALVIVGLLVARWNRDSVHEGASQAPVRSVDAKAGSAITSASKDTDSSDAADSKDATGSKDSTASKDADSKDSASESALAAGPRESSLEEALQIARSGLAHMQANLKDYRCRMVKRERVQGVLMPESEMHLKVQCGLTEGEQIIRPMRVYLRFERPSNIAGREVIWCQDKHDGRLLAHEGGLLGKLGYASLDPLGEKAMEGNAYPISEIGLMNLVRQLIYRGEHDLKPDQVRVEMSDDQPVGDRSCRQIQLHLLTPHEELAFDRAEIFIDTERQIPLRYAAYGSPDKDGNSQVLEEYTYLDVQTNVGLDESDFDPSNQEYEFPAIRINL